jgi:hypothetical protein
MAWEQEREKAEVNHAHHEVPLACLVRVLLVSRFHGPYGPVTTPQRSYSKPKPPAPCTTLFVDAGDGASK